MFRHVSIKKLVNPWGRKVVFYEKLVKKSENLGESYLNESTHWRTIESVGNEIVSKIDPNREGWVNQKKK